MKKIKVGVIFGGRSGEHEVSLVSATSVLKALDKDKYEPIEIGITTEGEWFTGSGALEKFKSKDYENLEPLVLSTDPKHPGFFLCNTDHIRIDVFFPVLHGPFGEDGTIQGLFEIMNIPYVGCGVLASSTAMDKMQCKAIWREAGLPVVDYVGFNRNAWEKEAEVILKDVETNIGFPCFVKPANMGSSVGITKVKAAEELRGAIDFAATFDRRILVEKGLDIREIECAILGNDEVVASPVGEVIVGGEFYDFYDKYVNGVSTTKIPADIEPEKAEKLQKISIKAFKLLDCAGLARVDCFVDKSSGEIFLNEINTMPGFTSISMYPKMMEAYGIGYQQLVDKLIELAFERFQDKQKNRVSFESGSEWFKG